MKTLNIWQMKDLISSINSTAICFDGVYYPGRTYGLFSIKNRLMGAWLVFTGKADVLVWDKEQ